MPPFCYECGYELSEEMKFCPKCGTSVKVDEPNEDDGFDITESNHQGLKPLSLEKNTSITLKFSNIKNNQWVIARISMFISLVAFVAVVLPFINEDIDIAAYGGAMIMVGLLFGITSFFVYFLFRKRAKILDELIAGKNILLHWKYDEKTWREYNENALKAKKTKNKATFIIITVVMVIVVGILLFATNFSEGALVTAVIMAVVWFLVFIAAYVGTYQSYNKLKNRQGEAILSKKVLWLSGELHIWETWGTRLEKFKYIPEKNILEIIYSAKARYGRQYFNIDLPVPQGKEAEAVQVATLFSR